MARTSGSREDVCPDRGNSPDERAARDETRMVHAQTVLSMARMMFATAVAVMILLIYTFVHADRDSASFYVSVVTCILDAIFIAYNIFITIRYTRLYKRLSGEGMAPWE
ncbi:MAG: hypothetical protein LBF63_10345 [Treponema sp.]|jgi:hypothetical protein|nr:hypothetical protein [Treponema sp.]